MTKKEKQSMIEGAMILISCDKFEEIYTKCDLGCVYVTNLIKQWANEFVKQLDWKGHDDDRDWLFSLEEFENNKFNEWIKTF